MAKDIGPIDKFERLRRQAEKLIGARRSDDAGETSSEILNLIHELGIHEVELQIQNEELRRAQQEIADLHREYENLYEFAPCGYITLNSKGIITRINLTGSTILGIKRELILRAGFSRFIAGGYEAGYFKALKSAGQSGLPQTIEFKINIQKGAPRWVRADITADREETGAITQWRMTLLDISERKRFEKTLNDSLQEKETLLMEVHHRVKNNLQIVASMLDMMSLKTDNPESIELIKEAGSKVFAMSLIHSQLYQSENYDRIEMKRCIRDLVGHISQVFGERQFAIAASIETGGIVLPITLAIPLAIVLNELIFNIFKHAFQPGEAGLLEVVMQQKETGKVTVTVKDNGAGISRSSPVKDANQAIPQSLGLSIARNIVEKQLHGAFHIAGNPGGGTRIDINFEAGQKAVGNLPDHGRELRSGHRFQCNTL